MSAEYVETFSTGGMTVGLHFWSKRAKLLLLEVFHLLEVMRQLSMEGEIRVIQLRTYGFVMLRKEGFNQQGRRDITISANEKGAQDSAPLLYECEPPEYNSKLCFRV